MKRAKWIPASEMKGMTTKRKPKKKPRREVFMFRRGDGSCGCHLHELAREALGTRWTEAMIVVEAIR